MAIGQHPAEHSNQAHLQDRPRSIGLSLPVNCQGLPGASNKARISSTVDGFQRIYAAVVPLFLTRGGGFYVGYETTLDVATLLLFPGHRTDGKFDGVNIEGNLHFRRKSTARDGRIPLGISRPMMVKAMFVSLLFRLAIFLDIRGPAKHFISIETYATDDS